MKKIKIIFGVIVLICLLNMINAEQSKRRHLDSLDNERLLDLLLEAKRRGLLLKSKDHENENQQIRRHMIADLDDEDNDQNRFVRRKVVGLGDDPFRR